MSEPTVELEFSKKYNRRSAEKYWNKHRKGLARRLSHWRDLQIVRKALSMAGEPKVVMDLPCGAGRFWPLLAEDASRQIIGADNSADMLAVSTQMQPPQVVARVKTLQTSAFDIDLPDQAVDSILCVRLMHHIEKSEHRLAILREFHRVTRDTVIFSLWVDGNFMATKRRKMEDRIKASGKPRKSHDRFLVARRDIEAEIAQAGFTEIGHIDFIPHYAMWRFYIVRKRA